ncbi:hypothetical protein [Arenibaculum sp.]|uniref:hypothetical protein n=1 Tax=Arenibaculum sp. TaxID=2865862 RepID=UPI002E0FE572|nr:hypothetical protein [Arenibaculum sp.]
MTGWYNPVELVKTGIRVAISTVFGQFADKREALAATNAIAAQPFDESFDYSNKNRDGDFWFDFVADTGDGWNPTYAVASLLAEDSLQPDGTPEPLARGRLLVMGGDQVYPTASRQEYEDRLFHPFEEAFKPNGKERWQKEERPDLYALPGNHDWYDGLRSFFHLFCRRTIKSAAVAGMDRDGRVIGGRQTRQTRSYFAVRLREDWWLWGTDSQLEGYIDQPQIDYFRHVAKHWMKPKSKLILCVGEPTWAYLDPDAPEKKYSSLSYLSRLAGAEEGMDHQLMLVLSGDSHHYARYREGDLNYVTCGGGGAFLHPTHHLRDKVFDFGYPPPGVPFEEEKAPYQRSFTIARKQGAEDEEALYPERSASWRLTFGNFLFPVMNWGFTLVLSGAYLLFTWTLYFNARVIAATEAGAASTGRGLVQALDRGDLPDAMLVYWQIALASPWPILLTLAALGGYYYFADVEKGWGRLLMGGLHALLQAVVVTATTCLVLRALDDAHIAVAIVAAAVVSGLASALTFGAYLWFSLAVLHRHWNEAFSSLRIEGFKSFLRLKIDRDGVLTVHPLGLRRPGDRPHLIEKPFSIPPRGVRP